MIKVEETSRELTEEIVFNREKVMALLDIGRGINSIDEK
jgi:hypothetical protein